ncbi:hypothetical protein BJ508DRAFT_380872 [Ascobolus immersus RN42]|uniref:Uncharacterized protein n=1 Tax=Ascobolus immersus RN42 TaxID=1160509 RepID=A0A3N4HIX5_ASCIM|nr:hypothetical protein BJ508DRAFT_380872 [Ascobolus immersus RN42]
MSMATDSSSTLVPLWYYDAENVDEGTRLAAESEGKQPAWFKNGSWLTAWRQRHLVLLHNSPEVTFRRATELSQQPVIVVGTSRATATNIRAGSNGGDFWDSGRRGGLPPETAGPSQPTLIPAFPDATVETSSVIKPHPDYDKCPARYRVDRQTAHRFSSNSESPDEYCKYCGISFEHTRRYAQRKRSLKSGTVGSTVLESMDNAEGYMQYLKYGDQLQYQPTEAHSGQSGTEFGIDPELNFDFDNQSDTETLVASNASYYSGYDENEDASGSTSWGYAQ